MAVPSLPLLGLLVLVPLVAWRLYARFRRLVGRQRLSRVRPWISLTVFPALLVLLVWLVQGRPNALAWLAAALVAGALLARYGLSRTVFEATPQGLFYTPHAPLGIALTVLLTGRIAYRVYEVISAGPAAAAFARSSLTLAVFGLLAGYYIAYAIGLLRWRRAHPPCAPEAPRGLT
jgi:hypothetical protein